MCAGLQAAGLVPCRYSRSMGENRSPLDADDLRARVEKALTQFVDQQRPLLQGISEDLEVVVDTIEASLSGGTRLRPAFAFWAWRGAGGDSGPLGSDAAA